MSFLEDALSRVSPGLLYALVAALSVELAAVLLLDFPAFGVVPILDLISLESPRSYAVIRAWYYLAPAGVVFAASLVLGELATRFFSRGGRVAFGRLHDAGMAALELLGRALSWRVVFSLVAGIAAYGWADRVLPFPRLGENPILDLVALEDPLAYYTIRLWCLAVPGLAAFGGGLILSGSWRVWLESRRGSRRAGRGTLPRWPAEADAAELQLVLGELHHPTDAKEVAAPQWLTLPERGLFTGIAIFGAVGSGKTSACMHPYARQIFHWRADDPKRRAAGLVLEVKGDFCHDVRRILEDAGRGDDYIEIALGGSWQWNPLDSDMDSYSLAYSVASLLNQLFGKGKEPFWQQAYTNLIRWTIELHRTLPGGWVTLRDLYRCAIDPTLLAEKIKEAQEPQEGETPSRTIDVAVDGRQQLFFEDPKLSCHRWASCGPGVVRAAYDQELVDHLLANGFKPETTPGERVLGDREARVEAVDRWYRLDWLKLDRKLRTSIVEGLSVFLSMFDLPDIARVFCPPPRPRAKADEEPEAHGELEEDEELGEDEELEEDGAAGGAPPPGIAVLRQLPPLWDLIDSGKVIALNMPAGASPALSRTVGVMLKNAWLQTLLKRPAEQKAHPGKYFRPAVFICDEYQSFATVGEDDPSGDEKSFALTRQSRCIPIVATQSISSLRSVLSGQEAWRALLQTLRTRIFLSLSDDSSADLASSMCGKVARMTASYSFSEQAKPGFSVVSGTAGGGRGSIGASKSFRDQREPMFHARQFALLENCQAIAIPYDGSRALPATRLYLKPCYLPHDRPYWRAREAGQI